MRRRASRRSYTRIMVTISGDNGNWIVGSRRNNLGLICYCYCIHTVYLAFPLHLVERALPTHWGCWLYSESGIVDDPFAHHLPVLRDDAIIRQVCPKRNNPNHLYTARGTSLSSSFRRIPLDSAGLAWLSAATAQSLSKCPLTRPPSQLCNSHWPDP